MCIALEKIATNLDFDGKAFVNSKLRSFHDYLAGNVVRDEGISYMFSRLPMPFYNAVFCDEGVDQKTYLKSLELLKSRKVPFVWFAEENSQLGKDLIENGGKSVGVFQAGAAPLPRQVPVIKVIDGIEIVHVRTLQDVAKQVDLIADCLKLSEDAKKVRLKIAEEQLGAQSPLQHWIAIKEGKAIAVVGLFIHEECAFFMNAVTLEPYRRNGFATALAIEGMKYALEKGCKMGMACIDPAEKAKGIGLQFDGKAYWRYTPVVFSPKP